MCLLCSNITSDTWGATDLSLQVHHPSVDFIDFGCINGNKRSAFQVLRQILNTTSLDIVMPAAYSHLSAPLINGSTLCAAVYLECCLLPCGGPLKALFCFHPSSACRYELSLIFLKLHSHILVPLVLICLFLTVLFLEELCPTALAGQEAVFLH